MVADNLVAPDYGRRAIRFPPGIGGGSARPARVRV